MFNIYKQFLKRNEILFEMNWTDTHWSALQAVSPDDAINEFRACKVPCCDCNSIKTSYELHKELEEYKKKMILSSITFICIDEED